MPVDMKALRQRMNNCCARMLEAAVKMCLERKHYEITAPHFLASMPAMGNNDFQCICAHFDVDTERLRRAVNSFLDQRDAGNTGRPQFAERLPEWLEAGRALCEHSLQSKQIRSGGLLLALLREPALADCPAYTGELRKIDAATLQRQFHEITKQSYEFDAAGVAEAESRKTKADRLTQVETELEATRTKLQTTADELTAARSELNLLREQTGGGKDLATAEAEAARGESETLEQRVAELTGELERVRAELAEANASREEAMAELAERTRQLETLAENSPDVLVRFDRFFRHTYANRKATEVTGISLDAYLGKTPAEVGFPEDVCSLWEEHCSAVLETGTPREMRYSLSGPAGTRRFRARIVPEMASDGTVAALLAIASDVTESGAEFEPSQPTGAVQLDEAQEPAVEDDFVAPIASAVGTEAVEPVLASEPVIEEPLEADVAPAGEVERDAADEATLAAADETEEDRVRAEDGAAPDDAADEPETRIGRLTSCLARSSPILKDGAPRVFSPSVPHPEGWGTRTRAEQHCSRAVAHRDVAIERACELYECYCDHSCSVRVDAVSGEAAGERDGQVSDSACLRAGLRGGARGSVHRGDG